MTHHCAMKHYFGAMGIAIELKSKREISNHMLFNDNILFLHVGILTALI